MPTRILMSWSSGKDSAWALQTLQRDREFEIAGLVTSVNEAFDRVAMHGVRGDLLRAQAGALGLPLHEIPLPHPCSDAEYERRFTRFLREAHANEIEAIAFGDLFLVDVRAYRERLLEGTGIAPVFPIWGLTTHTLSREMVDSGLRAVITCLDPVKLARNLAGRDYDMSFLKGLPPAIDPCGERGEFHTCVLDGPMFRRPVEAVRGEVVERDGFVFADLIPAASQGSPVPAGRPSS